MLSTDRISRITLPVVFAELINSLASHLCHSFRYCEDNAEEVGILKALNRHRIRACISGSTYHTKVKLWAE